MLHDIKNGDGFQLRDSLKNGGSELERTDSEDSAMRNKMIAVF
jgi:hypothetical protein